MMRNKKRAISNFFILLVLVAGYQLGLRQIYPFR